MNAALKLKNLKTKKEIDKVIRDTFDKVVVLRFGKEGDIHCTQTDDILSKCQMLVSKMADIYIIDVNDVPIYTKYFDITVTPSIIFFFNAQHMKIDFGTPDHTKYIGPMFHKQDFIDLIESIYRGAMRGKQMIQSPIDQSRIPKYEWLYKGV